MSDPATSEFSIFQWILCGVDGTPASLVAVQQAMQLKDEGGSLQLTAVANLAMAAHAGMAATHAAELLHGDAEAALAEAGKIAPTATGKLVNGEPVAFLLREAEVQRATLVAVGSHGRGRTAGMLLGTVAARMLRDAPCSVLIAREARDEGTWPRAVVVGVDGSAESRAAYVAARSVVERFGATLRAVAATGDQVDLEVARAIAPELEEQPGRALDLLAAASDAADLVLVGSRGLQGLKALGSVSERVSYRARSSVLIVRPGPAE